MGPTGPAAAGEGDDLCHGRVKDKNMKEKKREMALWGPAVCLVPTLNLQRAHSVVRFTSEGREEEEEFEEDILHNIFYVICSDTMLVKF